MATAATPSGSAASPDSNDSMLIVSGGEGYIDFRIGNTFEFLLYSNGIRELTFCFVFFWAKGDFFSLIFFVLF